MKTSQGHLFKNVAKALQLLIRWWTYKLVSRGVTVTVNERGSVGSSATTSRHPCVENCRIANLLIGEGPART